MENNALGCPQCKVALDERELVTKSFTVQDCPRCGTTVCKTDGFSGMNLAAVVAGDIAAIDSWLDAYARDSEQQIVKRKTDEKKQFGWSIGTPHNVAVECVYDQKNTGFVAIRALSKHNASLVFQNPDALTSVSTRFGFQPDGEQHNDWSLFEGTSSDGVWGMVDYVNTNSLTTSLLVSIAQRLHDAMQVAMSELFGDSKA